MSQTSWDDRREWEKRLIDGRGLTTQQTQFLIEDADAAEMKLSEVIATWEILHVKNTGELGYCDLQNALEEVGIEIQNDCTSLPEIQARLAKALPRLDNGSGVV